MNSPGTETGIIKLAIMAVGGQGGGVLTNWILDLARGNGYTAQATSVAGVAQRTGATIYYVEMMPRAERAPVFSLMPTPGDVDIVIAAELMEAGRAILRGFVTRDRTTLVASTHRMLAVSEKVAPGDGRAPGEKVLEAARSRAKRCIAFDLDQIAADNGTVISASLFGALAGSGALPFEDAHFEETIRASGRGVDASLAGFREARQVAHDRSEGSTDTGDATQKPESSSSTASVSGPPELLQRWKALEKRLNDIPQPARQFARLGLERVVDFQDTEYGDEYLDRLQRVATIDKESGGETRNFALTTAAAKYLAVAMTYDDVIRVADLKTRAPRFDRVRKELGVNDDQVLHLTEFMHPRAEEVCAMLPARWGRYIESRPKLFRFLDRVVNRGRRVRTDTMFWFWTLHMIAGLRRHRRRLLRHEVELCHLQAWMDAALSCAPDNYDLAVEIINNRRLVKGYSDTHERGMSKFSRVMDMLDRVAARDDAATCMREMREAALADEEGAALDRMIESMKQSPAA